jgi:hypothetical protein
MQTQMKPVLERRQEAPEESVCWNELSLAQKFSVSSLGKFGYDLLFVRNYTDYKLAILEGSGGVATIYEDGDIDTSPDIIIR